MKQLPLNSESFVLPCGPAGTPGTPRRHESRIHSDVEAQRVIGELMQIVTAEGFTEKDRFDVRLAVEEAVVNALQHGNRLDRTKCVRVRYRVESGNPAPNKKRLVVEIEDEGQGFRPDELPDPTAPENLERPHGRGVWLMRHVMNWVRFNERGNLVAMCKYCSPK